MRIGSLFAGIGGLELGLEWAGVGHTVWQVEKDAYCRAVLARHWPDAQRFDDVRTVGAHNLPEVDVICGGYPCQPFSVAGKRNGADDERHLWPEYARILCELRPRYAVLENVPGHLVLGFGDVLGDLAQLGYDAEWGVLSAAGVGAPHLRRRLFVVAYTQHKGLAQRRRAADSSANRGVGVGISGVVAQGRGIQEATGSLAHALGQRLQAGIASGSAGVPGCRADRANGYWSGAEPDVGRVAHGVRARVDRLRALGNAVVPQVAEKVGQRLMAIHAALQASEAVA